MTNMERGAPETTHVVLDCGNLSGAPRSMLVIRQSGFGELGVVVKVVRAFGNDHTELPEPRLADDQHGTRCAGEIAAVKNDVCGVGVAYTWPSGASIDLPSSGGPQEQE
jgi:hypothetical protein